MPVLRSGSGIGGGSLHNGQVIRRTTPAEGPLWQQTRQLYVTPAPEVQGSVFTAAVSGGIQSDGAATTSRLLVKTYTASGGLASGGTAVLARVVIRSATVSGGLQSGGTAARALVQSVAPAGGYQLGGGAAVSRSRVSAVSGGVTAAGTAATARTVTKTYLSSGGLTLAGSADLARVVVRSVTPSGGLVSGGTADVDRVQDVTPVGGASLGGSATFARTFAPVSLGGLQTAGAAALARTRAASVSGTVQTAGTAQVTVSHAIEPTGGLAVAGQAIAFLDVAGSGEEFRFIGSGGGFLSGSAAASYIEAEEEPPVQLPGNSATYASPPRPQAQTYEYAASGSFSLGGSAGTDFLTTITWQFDGGGIARISGSASTERHDPFAQARAEDDDLLLIG